MPGRWFWICGVLVVIASFAIDASSQTVPEKKTSQEYSEFPFIGQVNTENLNVRILPKSDNTSTIVAILKLGEEVTVIGQEGNWFKILPPKGTWCWINASSVKVEGDKTAVVTDEEANLRSDSRVTAYILGTVKKGEKLTVLGENLGWFKVQPPDTIPFYVAARYIKFLKPLQDSQTTGVKQSAFENPVSAEESKLLAKIKEDIQQQDKLLEEGKVKEVSYLQIIVLLQKLVESESQEIKAEAQALQKTCITKQIAIEKLNEGIDDLDKRLLEKEIEHLKATIAQKQEEQKPKFDFVGVVDTTGKWLRMRPGTHKLIDGVKTIAFLRTRPGDQKTLDLLNLYYGRKVGVIGQVMEDPPGWKGYKLVFVEKVVPVED